MRNKKLRHAGFNITMQNIVEDNWRFLSAICVVLEREFGFKRKRLEKWDVGATAYVKKWNDYDEADIFRPKLEGLIKEQGGGIITWDRAMAIVAKNTTLKNPAHISEIVDNLILELLMTVREFDKASRERLTAGLEALSREEFDNAPKYIFDRFGIEVDRGFQDYYGILRERKSRLSRESRLSKENAGEGIEAFRRWSEVNNPKI